MQDRTGTTSPAETLWSRIPDRHILRGDAYSLEHLEEHARKLAGILRVSRPSVKGQAASRAKPDPVTESDRVKGADRSAQVNRFERRFRDNAQIIREAYQVLRADTRADATITPDAEWLLDNFYIVEDQLREIMEDLPRRYYLELPKIVSGEPRVFALSLELIIHTDSMFDEEMLVRYIRAFQERAALSIGETWAFPIMLRLGLVENLRRLSAQILSSRACRAEAEQRLALGVDERLTDADFHSEDACTSLVVQLMEQLHEGGKPADELANLERKLAERKVLLSDVVHAEHQRQAVNQVTIGNVITSMRLISALDWVVFFEKTNPAEQALRRDPAGIYAEMDFETRNRYRDVVEELAKQTQIPDADVAATVVDVAWQSGEGAEDDGRLRHIGHFLVDQGRREVERRLGFRASIGLQWMRFAWDSPNAFYLGLIGVLTTILSVSAGLLARWTGGSIAEAMALSFLALIPASEAAVNLTNLLVTKLLRPRLLPRLEFKAGVPAEWSTFVVIPTLLTGRRGIESNIQRLEMHYLANAEPHLRFALLTDFGDATREHMPEDEEFLRYAIEQIRALNDRHGAAAVRPFFLFHRERRWNEGEQKWMGWERKRGKIMEFNRLLRGASDTTFVASEGDISWFRSSEGAVKIRFVITLDADTQLPYGAARRLIGTLAHPLNRPQFGNVNAPGNSKRSSARPISGYAILQPRVSVHLASANQTWFSWIFSNSRGIDPYATSASDVYQDLYGEGTFTGKGIYDVDALERSLRDVFPENHILSHDLIEGCHSRAALVSDVELIDSYPGRYDADVNRQHRWARGDWQLLPWLMPRVPTATGRRWNPLTALSHWKITDNLRRSLVPISIVAFVVSGWLFVPDGAWLWTGILLSIVAFPLVGQILSLSRPLPHGVDWRDFARGLGSETARTGLQVALSIAFLPHRAWTMVDAIVRTLFRMFVSRRHLLEWETSAAAERRVSRNGWKSMAALWVSPALAIAVGLGLQPGARGAVAGILVAWLVAPAATHWLNRPWRRRKVTLSDEDQQRLRQIARRTWAFFETFVTENDHWLPPDNIQEFPSERIAHRISPTNEGLYLVSALAARDLGFMSLTDLVTLWERNLAHWTGLEKHQGHYYNWYDTLTLQPLAPRYISTVDSGNLAASLLTIGQGLGELKSAEVFDAAIWNGFRGTVQYITDECDKLHPRGARLVNSPWDRLATTVRTLGELCPVMGSDPVAWSQSLGKMHEQAGSLHKDLAEFRDTGWFPDTDLLKKIDHLQSQLCGLENDFDVLFGWAHLIAAESSPRSDSENSSIPRPHCFESLDGGSPSAWDELWALLANARTPLAIRDLSRQSEGLFQKCRDKAAHAGANDWLTHLGEAIAAASHAAAELISRMDRLSELAESESTGMDFSFLYNPQRRLFSIGYNLDEGRADRAHYDLLCSEARLASYLAIAKGDVEHRHWFQMGRPATRTAGEVALLSWGGTMFEYLMPLLFLENYEGSSLEHSCRTAVLRQKEYGRQRGVPWGISESAFGALAGNSDYQYRSFGVPGLGLKRGLGKDLVVSPYSTFLASEIDPAGVTVNLSLLTREGGGGSWGFYDSIDYTADRLPAEKRCVIVRCYMSHHQGMSLLALTNLLCKGSIRRRFHSHPFGRAPDLLLQEGVPQAVPQYHPHEDEATMAQLAHVEDEWVSRRLTGIDTPSPRTHLLSNGSYSVMLTSTGGGFSQCNDTAITRWRPDPTRDHWGQFVYVRDLSAGRVWSAAFQPTRAVPDVYEVIYSVDKAEYRRRDGDLETCLEVTVSPENNAEIRQVKLTNHGSRPATVELTSYGEFVLCSAEADAAHPAFQKLFVETEFIAEESAIIAHRRPRSPEEAPRWAIHVVSGEGRTLSPADYETSRSNFLGRGRTPANPVVMEAGVPLTGTTGTVLDPIFALRCLVTVSSRESATVAFTTAAAASRDEALVLADQYHDARGVQRAFELAWAFHQVELRHLHLSPARAHTYQRLASALLYPDRALRGASEPMIENPHRQRDLWRYGISGDVPIVLLHVDRTDQIPVVRELLSAQAYWRRCGLKSDVVILNDRPGSYLDALQEELQGVLNERLHPPEEKSIGTYLLRGAQIPREEHVLLEAAAAVVLHGDQGAIARQLESRTRSNPPPPEKVERNRQEVRTSTTVATRPRRDIQTATAQPEIAIAQEKLILWNGRGGLTPDGREYHIHLRQGESTPVPWSNIVANPHAGFLITEAGGGYTWVDNSREFKLSNWSNDPVTDPPGEVLYLRDDATGEIWQPISIPQQRGGDGWVHHGQGYTRFVQRVSGLDQETIITIAPNDPVKIVHVRIRNRNHESRKLSLTYFVDWVLGSAREQTQRHIVTSVEPETRALLARNAYHPENSESVAFLSISGRPQVTSGDRAAFIGRNGNLTNPEALRRMTLDGCQGAGIDPCGAVQTSFSIGAGQAEEVFILLGAGKDEADTQSLLQKYQDTEEVKKTIAATAQFWEESVNRIEIRTPNREMDLLFNRWLPYQVLSCRFWGRSAFYQSGGAFGFRDQLQDSMALVYSHPELAREHLVRSAARQFVEGDVQHWWHPPTGRGTRTRFADDFLWLPFAACHYAERTGDASVWNEVVPFLQSPLLELNEQERYETPAVSTERGTLYEHCLRAVRRGFRRGPHGLPLMGCGDWNDGMNRVGSLGQGESVWLGWFLLVILERFLPIMQARGDSERAREFAKIEQEVRDALEIEAWDGEWYRRAYFDNGATLGAKGDSECRIDSLAQTWAVFAKAKNAAQAMEAVWEQLVRREDGLVLLFTPPFDRSVNDPGYVQAYPPGIRENGGQYTHAATWAIQAFTELGDADRAMEILDLINPLRHTSTFEGVERYQVEPYVVAADVYSAPQHTGRGGWTWYTGSAAWLYRAVLEDILGFDLRGDRIAFHPSVPKSWSEFKVTYRRGKSVFHITVTPDANADEASVIVDGQRQTGQELHLVDDGAEHEVTVSLASKSTSAPELPPHHIRQAAADPNCAARH